MSKLYFNVEKFSAEVHTEKTLMGALNCRDTTRSASCSWNIMAFNDG